MSSGKNIATCDGCDKVYAYSAVHKKAPDACSHECYLAIQERKKQAARKRPPAACKYCGEALPEVRGANMKYCGQACMRSGDVAKRYGLTPPELFHLRSSGDGCHICGWVPGPTHRSLAVDHCHETGQVRGLLCFPCNTAIGKLKDDPDLLRRAADYLEAARA